MSSEKDDRERRRVRSYTLRRDRRLPCYATGRWTEQRSGLVLMEADDGAVMRHFAGLTREEFRVDAASVRRAFADIGWLLVTYYADVPEPLPATARKGTAPRTRCVESWTAVPMSDVDGDAAFNKARDDREKASVAEHERRRRELRDRPQIAPGEDGDE